MMIMPAGSAGRPRFLASVTNVAEAETAMAAGADIIDCKDPSAGALGALPHGTVRAIVDTVAGRVPVSATVGDLQPTPDVLCHAVVGMAATGAGYVKIGFFEGGDAAASIAALGRLALANTRLIGLLLADRHPDLRLIPAMAAAGFAGVMLDTASKKGRALPDVMPVAEMAAFIAAARSAGMLAGLAGALRREHIPAIAAQGPDVIGFRGALCSGNKREGALEEGPARAIANALAAVARAPAPRHASLEALP
jgi:uncharacterized protein (UPF0264 family)